MSSAYLKSKEETRKAREERNKKLRNEFSTVALGAVLSREGLLPAAEVAKLAVEYADALLIELGYVESKPTHQGEH